MLASRRAEAEALGVPPDLIEDVLRRVMRESYSSENDKGFKTLCPSLRPVVIVGGGGQMGRLFEKMLTLSGYQVRIPSTGGRQSVFTQELLQFVQRRNGPGGRDAFWLLAMVRIQPAGRKPGVDATENIGLKLPLLLPSPLPLCRKSGQQA